jgi:hypothetical protein
MRNKSPEISGVGGRLRDGKQETANEQELK